MSDWTNVYHEGKVLKVERLNAAVDVSDRTWTDFVSDRVAGLGGNPFVRKLAMQMAETILSRPGMLEVEHYKSHESFRVRLRASLLVCIEEGK